MQGWGDVNLFSLQVIIYWCFVNTHLVPSTNAQVPVCVIPRVMCGLFFSTRSVLLWFSLVPRWVLCEWPSTQPWPQPFLEVSHSTLYISLCYTFCCMKLTKPALYCRYSKPLCVSGVRECQYLWDLPPWKSTWLRRGGYWLGWVHHVTQFICTLYIVHFTQHLTFCRELGSYANTISTFDIHWPTKSKNCIPWSIYRVLYSLPWGHFSATELFSINSSPDVNWQLQYPAAGRVCLCTDQIQF